MYVRVILCTRKPLCLLVACTLVTVRAICWALPYSFQNSFVIEAGLTDFHKITVIVMKTTYEKLKSKITNYRDCKNFSSDKFWQIFFEKLSTENIYTNYIGTVKFLQNCINELKIFSPCKKMLRGIIMSSIDKFLWKKQVKEFIP